MSTTETATTNGQAAEQQAAIVPAAVRRDLAAQSTDNSENAILFDRPKFEQAWAVAKLFAASQLVPQHFQGKPENCFIACQLAFRFKMDPFMVMQGTYVVSGKPGFEGKFIIALVNASRLFEDPLDFEFTGTPNKEDWTCTASAKRAKTGKLCSLPFQFSVAKAEGWTDKGGSKWKTMPHQMMMYRAATFFARVYCPEVIMGMQSADELEDIGPEPTLADLPTGRSSFRPDAPKPAAVEEARPTVTGEVIDRGTGEVQPAEGSAPEPLFGKKAASTVK